MFVDDVRRAIEAAPRVKLAELSAALWKAYGAGLVPDDECQALAELIEARKVVPTTPVVPVVLTRRTGSRPKTADSLERRRRWVASGWMPPQVAGRFTLGEAAVLSVVAAEIARHAQCTLAVEAIAAKAGVSKSTVRNALAVAKQEGLLVVIARPDRPFRHQTNVIRITSPEWRSWLAMRRSSQGSKSSDPTKIHSYPFGKDLRGSGSATTARPIQNARLRGVSAPWAGKSSAGAG